MAISFTIRSMSIYPHPSDSSTPVASLGLLVPWVTYASGRSGSVPLPRHGRLFGIPRSLHKTFYLDGPAGHLPFRRTSRRLVSGLAALRKVALMEGTVNVMGRDAGRLFKRRPRVACRRVGTRTPSRGRSAWQARLGVCQHPRM